MLHPNYTLDKKAFNDYVKSILNDPDNEQTTDIKNLLELFVKNFRAEFLNDYTLRRYKTVENCLTEWLKGLPSYIDTYYHDFDIIKLYMALENSKLSLTDLTEDEQINEVRNFFNLVAKSLNELLIENKIEPLF